MAKSTNNSNQQLLNQLEQYRTEKTRVRVKHNRTTETGLITKILVGRYKLFIQVNNRTIFPADLCTITVLATQPKHAEQLTLPYDATSLIKGLYAAVGVER